MKYKGVWKLLACLLASIISGFLYIYIYACLDIVVLTIVKVAMNDGMSSIVYVIYQNALGTLTLFPLFIIHILRNVDRPPLTFRILFRFFILGLLGISVFQVLWFLGVDYSSPTMASAILNLLPGITFLIAVFFRMEKIDMKSTSSIAKLSGTMIAISGAMVFTFYQGPGILNTISSPTHLFLSQPSKWILGCLITFISVIFACMWLVLQTTTAREYPDQQTIVFFFCFFGTIQCVALSPFLELNQSAWVLQDGIRVTAVILGGVYSCAFRNSILTWCLGKKGPIFIAMFSPLSIVLAVILGVTFLGDSLYLGSVIGSVIIAVGFYTMIWGQAKEKNKIAVVSGDDLDVSSDPGSYDQSQRTPLLSSKNEPAEC